MSATNRATEADNHSVMGAGSECQHEMAKRHFSRFVFTTKVGVTDFHIRQTCLNCGRRSSHWLGHNRFRDPSSLPLDGDPNPVPNADQLHRSVGGSAP